MVDTLHGFSRNCLSSAQLLDLQGFAATRATAIDMTGQVRASIKAAAPGQRVKGKTGRPSRIGAAYRLDKGRNQALVFARGPLHLVERDTKAHGEPRNARRRAKYQRARDAKGRIIKKGQAGYVAPVLLKKAGFRVLNIPGIGYRASVKHPGTKGKHPFGRAVASYVTSKKATSIYSRHVRKVLRGIPGS